MENALNMILNAENVRTLVTIVSIIAWGTIYIKKLEYKIESSTKELEYKIKELDYKIEALSTRMDNSFKALTYVLEKNGTLSKEDKEYVDSRLAL